ncbi:MAG TPA: hypothetical protein VN540_10065 [Clostridia bacterium]|nr:hypothetical protein [Clostridia bacterium]
MSTQIANQAVLTYRCGTNDCSVASNIATTQLRGPLSVTKLALGDSYRAGEALTFLLLLENVGVSQLTNIELADDLGAFTLPGPVQVTPLDCAGRALLFVDGALRAELTPVANDSGAVFALGSLPAGSRALIFYRARVNSYAPLATGSTITNNVVAAAPGISEPVLATCTLTVADYADVSILKAMSPNPLTEGGALTYAFTIYNYGNSPAEDLVLSDQFSPVPLTIAVALDGAPVGSACFSYNEGNFVYPQACSGMTPSVPAASFSQDPATGFVAINPGMMLLTVSGII